MRRAARVVALVAVARAWAPPQHRAARPPSTRLGSARTPCTYYDEVTIPAPAAGPPVQDVTVVDLMPSIKDALAASGFHVAMLDVYRGTNITEQGGFGSDDAQEEQGTMTHRMRMNRTAPRPEGQAPLNRCRQLGPLSPD